MREDKFRKNEGSSARVSGRIAAVTVPIGAELEGRTGASQDAL